MKTLPSVIFCCTAAVALSLGSVVSAQQPQTTAPQGASVKATSEEVLLDVIVRDKKGHAANELKAEDFQIFDNGEPKKITSFRLVQGNEAVAAGGSRTQLDPLRQIRLVTLIIQCWNNDAQRLARDAALDLVKSELPQNVYMAVMTIDHKLEVLQPFTNDRDLLRKAIERATRGQNTDFSQDTDRVKKQLEETLGPNSASSQSTQGQIGNMQSSVNPSQNNPPSAGTFATIQMAQMLLDMITTEQSNAMAEGGRVNIYSLEDAVKEQYRLPGRKTILYFSEGGFTIPQGMEEPFKNVISIANRSNVSFYAVDTHGLTTWSTNSGAMDSLNRAAQSSQDQQSSAGAGGQVAVRPDQAKLLDTAIGSTRGNSQTTLANLAESTGGALIANTNDLRGPIHRLSEDIETYYEITYAPEIKNYDGSFRKIAIKMASNDLRVQARSGYIALPPTLAAKGMVLRSFEVPLLTALNSPDLPHAFTYHSEAMHFRGMQNQPVCDLVMDVPLGNVTLQKSTTADQFEGRLSYVALVKGEKGEVLKKFQNDIPINVPATKLEALKAGHYIYTEHFDLSPGHYTVETAVLDGEGNRVSARKNSLIMPAPSSALSISSVSVVRNMKDKDASTDQADPLLIGSRVVSPTLNPTISKAGNPNISFYLVIYLNKSASQPPRLSMEFSRNGQVLGSGSPELGQPDKDGRIQYVATAPLSSLEPGEYAIRFSATQGAETAEELTTFILQ